MTTSRPDLVVVDSSPPVPTVYLFELTVCFERVGNMEAANARKYDRYSSLADDIKEAGYDCKNIPFEIGSRGHITLENKSKLTIVHKLCNPRTNSNSGRISVKQVFYLLTQSVFQEMTREQKFQLPIRK